MRHDVVKRILLQPKVKAAAGLVRRTTGRIVGLAMLLLLTISLGGTVPNGPASAAACSSPSFGPPSSITVGEAPSAVVTNDFNSDGKLDLATANFVSDNVSLLMGNGSGGFGSNSVVPAGNAPSDLASGDLNNDRHPDLVVVNQISDNVTVLLGDGTGGFAPPTTYPVDSDTAGTGAEHQPVAVAVGDLNNDGKLDLAVANLFNGVTVLLGDGAGGFGAPSRVGPWPGGNPADLATGDFNEDGRLDLAVGRPGLGDVAFYRNDGGGKFSATSVDKGVNTLVESSDINRDGHLDLVASDNGGNRIGLLAGRGFTYTFDPQFSPPSYYSVGNLPRALLTGDFNGDGKPDVVVAKNREGSFSSDVSVFLGDGAGGLGPQTAFTVGEGADGLAAGDFNGDGGLDVVTANNRSNDVSVLLNTCPTGPIDLRPTAIEATQSIQDLNNSVVLVEGKRTFARVHVATNVGLTHMTARLYGYDASGTPLPGGPLWPANPGAVIDPSTSPNRAKMNDSFYFELPPSWTKGSVTLKAEVNPYHTLSETDYGNNTTSTSVTFQPTHTLKVRLVKYEYFDPKGILHAATDKDLASIESRLRREYPISKLSVSRTTFRDMEQKWDPSNFFPLRDLPVLVSRLQWFRQTYEPTNTGVVYLLVNDGVLTTGGIAERIPGWNATAGSAETADHEIGHLMGRRHVSCTPNPDDEAGPDLAYPYVGGKIGGPSGDTARYYGFDVGDTALTYPVLPNVVTNDVGDMMSYCNPSWLSDYNYTAVRDYIQQNFSATDPEGDFLSVYGSIDTENQTASLREVSRQPRVSEIPPRVSGSYHLRLFDAVGNRLADYPFAPAKTHVEPGGNDVDIVAQVVNFVPGTRRVAIYSEQAGRELTSVAVSANSPNVTGVTANSPSGGGQVTLAWKQSDPDTNELRSTVLYSNDGGTDWQTIATGIQGTTYTLDSSDLPGTGDNATGIFRVVVNDGVLTAAANSTPLAVPGKTPDVRITSPLTGSTYVKGQTVTLEGVAEDLEDGTLDDAHLSWSSDRDGFLGTGHLIDASSMSVGTHRVTLTATDSDREIGTQTVTVNVVAGYENPAPDDSTPPAVQCTAADGLWHASDVNIDCTARDSGSGLANPDDTSFSLSTNLPSGTEDSSAPTTSRIVCDRASNCTMAGPITGNKLDKQAPGIVISAPVNGSTYSLKQAVAADYACTDGGSGTTSCSGTIPDGGSIDTSTLGAKIFRVDTADTVGNKDSQTVNYGVIYDFSGFFSPVDNPDVLNQVKAGSAIPVKFSLGGDQGLNIFAKDADGSSYPKSAAMTCDSTDPVDAIEQTVTADASGLTYDATTNRYTYVWKTSKEWKGCRQLVMKLNDGSVHIANFKFTK